MTTLITFTKKEFLEILKETLHKIKTNQTNFPKIGDCIVEFLYKNQDTKTFEEFFNTFAFTKLNLINNNIQNYKYYLKSDTPWQAIFEDITEKGEIGFIETWIPEEETELFYNFLETECNIELLSKQERMLKITEKYIKTIEENKNYQSYWKKENAIQRFFDEYITFIYDNPNSNTARKLLNLFEKDGIHFLEKLKAELLSNKNQAEFIKNWIDKEEIELFLYSRE
ncbi:MAG: hypothetical protein JHC31_05555 [Sulfurihydrogenibium sp.]|jgi:hypothetical protein|nr:hypothetical protein [Sulfurihydrogenibium sp.]